MMPGITSVDALQAYLASKSRFPSRIDELQGGFSNFVWRLTAQDGTTSVVKHAEPYVKFNQDLSLPAERMDFEATAMIRIGALLADVKPELRVSPPTVESYDSNEHLLMMSDGCGQNLKALYEQRTTDQVRGIGERLACWLAELHKRSAAESTSIGEGGNKIARTIYRHSYQGLQQVLAKYGLGGTEGVLGKEVDEKYGPVLQTDDVCVCHGDFWPGNIIVNDTDSSQHVMDLTIVDWEICRRGVPATDVAQFVAEAYLLDRFSKSSHGLAKVFLETYISIYELADDFWERFLVHWATHVIFWPTFIHWMDNDEHKQLAEFAVSLIPDSMLGGSKAKEVYESKFKDELSRVAQ